MAARKKKKPWNAGLVIPGVTPGTKSSPTPASLPGNAPLGPSTGTQVEPQWQCLLCDQLADGVTPTVEEHALRCSRRNPETKS